MTHTDVERTLRSSLREANTQANRLRELNAEMLAALKFAESALAPFSKEPAERSGINMIRNAIAKAQGR